ncbi:MAG TPA: hypothetical protein VG013_21150 [Gemmataceae bacterium]|jgi:hypothetical protein|nr:hypothetical protein [Gemmataceae bacterium]
MNRLRRWSFLACFIVLATVGLSRLGGQAPAAEKPAANKWLLDRSLTLTPRRAPVPALKYRLFPRSSELKDGNAVPIYLRLVFEQSDAARRRWVELPSAWNKLPLERLPMAEARKFLQGHRNFLRQCELGARRKTAEWNYTLDQGSFIDILLPDVQQMRGFMPMLVLKVRVEIAEGNYEAAAHWLETGFAFSRHLSEGPFLINELVGIAGANLFEDTLLDFVDRPDAPNLYWSLVALPRPLIPLRHGLEMEQRVLEMQFPELVDLDRERTLEQWAGILKSFRVEFKRIMASDESGKKQGPLPGTSAEDPADKSPDLSTARKYLADRMHVPATKVEAMPPAELLVRYLVGSYREYSDDLYKASYLPYPEARPGFAEADKRRCAAPDTEAKRLASAFLAAVSKVMTAENRVQRKIAALRVIEALRMYAADHDGGLPDKLSDVTVVPVPDDPGTGKPFKYRRDGQSATLTGRIPGMPLDITGLRYRLTMREK